MKKGGTVIPTSKTGDNTDFNHIVVSVEFYGTGSDKTAPVTKDIQCRAMLITTNEFTLLDENDNVLFEAANGVARIAGYTYMEV